MLLYLLFCWWGFESVSTRFRNPWSRRRCQWRSWPHGGWNPWQPLGLFWSVILTTKPSCASIPQPRRYSYPYHRRLRWTQCHGNTYLNQHLLVEKANVLDELLFVKHVTLLQQVDIVNGSQVALVFLQILAEFGKLVLSQLVPSHK